MTLSEDTRYLNYYRACPSKWVEHSIDIELAHYRDRTALESWLQTQPADGHTWCREMLAQDRLTLDSSRSYQAEALDMLAEPGRYTLPWANGTSKTATAALAVAWFLDVYPDGKCVSTAGTWSQLREQLWREIPHWLSRAKRPIAPNAVKPQKTQIEIDSDWVAFGRAATEEQTFEGVHSKNLMIIMDETKAIREGIFAAARRLMRGDPEGRFWWIALGSPGSPVGPFWDIVEGDQAHRWTCMRMSAYESDRIGLDLIGEDWEDLGDQSPLFISMNCADFPAEGEDTILPLSWVQAAVGREVNGDGPRTLGVDVARFGSNETVFYEFLGRRGRLVEAYNGKDLMQTAGRVVRLRSRYDAAGVDDVGLGGGVTDRCVEQDVDIMPINAGSRDNPSSKTYVDLGTEIMFALRDVLEEGYKASLQEGGDDPDKGISLEPDKKLISQLSGRRYRYLSDGRIQAESKDEMRRRGLKSPDRADGAGIAWWVRGGHLVPVVVSSDDEGVRKAQQEGGHEAWDYRAYQARRPDRFGRMR